MNEILRTIAGRYSCRDYKNDMVSDELLQAIAEAAVQAPSGMNRQAWRVVVIKNQDLIRDIEAEGMAFLAGLEDQSAYQRIMGRGGKLFYGAPCMIVVPIDQAQFDAAQMDCGILCQNITLAAASLGLGSVICGLAGVAFAGKKGEEFGRRLGFPEGYVFGCSVLLGYANTTKEPHTPDLEKISFIE